MFEKFLKNWSTKGWTLKTIFFIKMYSCIFPANNLYTIIFPILTKFSELFLHNLFFHKCLFPPKFCLRSLLSKFLYRQTFLTNTCKTKCFCVWIWSKILSNFKISKKQSFVLKIYLRRNLAKFNRNLFEASNFRRVCVSI